MLRKLGLLQFIDVLRTGLLKFEGEFILHPDILEREVDCDVGVRRSLAQLIAKKSHVLVEFGKLVGEGRFGPDMGGGVESIGTP